MSDEGRAAFRRIDERTIHQGRVWRAVVGSFEAPDGTRFERDIVRSPGAVAVVPVRFDPEGNPMVVLVRQYRPPFDAEIVEIPAGLREDGEDPEETAHRELAEECVLAAGRLVPLTRFLNAAGMTDAATHVYVALDLTAVPSAVQGPEEEHLTVHVLPLAEAVAGVEARRIVDAKTVIGLLLTERWLTKADALPFRPSRGRGTTPDVGTRA